MTSVSKSVLALIRGTCGEQYLDEQTSARLLTTAQEAARAGVSMDMWGLWGLRYAG
ncbi:MAG TPA: hypothetical protein VN837_02155 [Chloroflexota bacterium]|nr:hypothetical protein [Chloroflexota bacterium]